MEKIEQKRLSRIVGKCQAKSLAGLVQPLMQEYQVKILRKPAKTMVMIRMKETVAKADFYLGELLACEAMVEVNGQKGFALQAGDDLDKVLYAAVLDAVLKSEIPSRDGLISKLLELEKEIQEKEQKEIRMHQATRVKFETLDAEA